MGTMLLAFTGMGLAQSTTPTQKTTPSNQQSTQPTSGQPTPPLTGNPVHVCPAPPGRDMARCHAIRLDNPKKVASSSRGTGTANPSAGSGPGGGFAPSDLQTAYKLTSSSSTNGTGQTIAIVDAYDDPNAQSDLGVYRSQFGLPPMDGQNGHPTFTKVNQNGSTTGPWPRGDGGWAQEISLDLDMASAICPNCNILLVEANSNSYTDLGAAVNEAATLGAGAISNSYGGGEFSGETSYEAPYNHPGIAVTVSSGDSGYGVEFPASSRYVTAVGGTSLYVDSAFNRSSEAVWSGAGSGCSAYILKPSWQTDSGCSNRTVADVAAVANPNTGVSVYDTYSDKYGSGIGWMVFGGTSVASPIIASVYALAGNTSSINGGSFPYSHTNDGTLFDVTSGSNGTCSPGYLCTGGPSYDGPTGLGTPNGTGAFGSGTQQHSVYGAYPYPGTYYSSCSCYVTPAKSQSVYAYGEEVPSNAGHTTRLDYYYSTDGSKYNFVMSQQAPNSDKGSYSLFFSQVKLPNAGYWKVVAVDPDSGSQDSKLWYAY